MKQRLSNNTVKLFILVTSLIVWVSANQYDFFESIALFVSRYDKWEVDELIALSLYLFIVFSVLVYKKSKDLEREIQKRTLLEKELEQSLVSAEAANRAKSEFLATMSHELRTPLNSIIGFSNLMLTSEVNIDKQRKYLNNISSSGKHLLSIINSILDISKVEAGKLELHYEKFDIYGAIDEVKNIIFPLASEKEINIEFFTDDSLKEIYADRVRFKQILFNLISNAIKFTPNKGKIIISTSLVGNMFQCTVKDTGIGISEENKKELFKPFTQLHSCINRTSDGTGLGLTLVKQFVELHQGRIWFESELGKGSSFSIELPLQSV
ncbi:HAMP domain-containing sensor histidine kinase [Methanolobus vulcani]|uniref:histidine kinase n=1 Tax=Methanolobus vulcani TaxID=38026 RepID=A0A7Z8KNT4_9EURY|nr:ATP-binding protein [Methanolobus vulcani]TQD26113.1 hypothetical protein FKV42_04950 [Methanolobus vulcani]